MWIENPRKVPWPSDGGVGIFIDVFDWDYMTVYPGIYSPLLDSISLCVGLFPCTLSVRGSVKNQQFTNGQSIVQQSGNGSILCIAASGCTSVLISGLDVRCSPNGPPSMTAVIEVDGSQLTILGCTFDGCRSYGDGAAIKSYHGASVYVSDSLFKNSFSAGSGGALSGYGGSLLVKNSAFENCSAAGNGGAVAAGNYFCFAEHAVYLTNLELSNNTFSECRAGGFGGAVWGASNQSLMTIENSNFLRCISGNSGGSVSVSDRATAHITDCEFVNNTAEGIGGGAMHSNGGVLTLHGVSCNGNTATRGGGGVLFWEGDTTLTIVPWCSAGAYADNGFTPLQYNCRSCCRNCVAGTFLTGEGALDSSECVLCSPGTYSSEAAATVCSGCSAGTFSGEGASECAVCNSGYMAPPGSESCQMCIPGTYSTGGAGGCVSCEGGFFSTAFGAVNRSTCIPCGLGSYSASGAEMCQDCDAGTYCTAIAATTCSSCVAGTFSITIGAATSDTCLRCIAGMYSDRSAALCSQCAAGKYSDSVSATSETSCLPCDSGTYSGPGFNMCLQPGSVESGLVSALGEDGYLSMSLPFEFPFFGASFNQTSVNTNGFVEFGPSEIRFGNPFADSPIPNGRGIYIAAFWAQLTPSDSGMFLYRLYEDTAVFQWTDWSIGSLSDSRLTFQILLFRNGSILISFLSLQGDGSSGAYATIGIESFGIGYSVSSHTRDCFSRLCIQLLPTTGNRSHYTIEKFFCNASGRLAPICQAGYYLGTDYTCFPCESGKYQTGTGIFEGHCTACEAGKYANISGASSPDQCAEYNRIDTKRGTQHVAFGNAPLKQSWQRNARFPDSWQGVSKHSIAQQGILRMPPPRIADSPLRLRMRDMCSEDNSALYGPCFASAIKNLKNFPAANSQGLVQPGLPFLIEVVKLDAYGQIIASDSSTIVQVRLRGIEGYKTATIDSTASILGSDLIKLRGGVASASVAILPSFTSVDLGRELVVVAGGIMVSVAGIDAQTMARIQSNEAKIGFKNGSDICPRGYILALDTASSALSGSCTLCQAGTYSVNPLFRAAINGSSPLCLNCPPDAVCRGGDDVSFRLGKWTLSRDMYLLIGCPDGHALMNSIQGVFSHDIQRCVECAEDEYVLNPNSSRFSCQKCPIGALCNGSSLRGLVLGSVWRPDMESGQYVLESCPAGYELQNTIGVSSFSYLVQRCSLCPASYYCEGGADSRHSCPDGTFSPPGSNASTKCVAVIFVFLSVSLPLLPASFDESLQQNFKQAVAYTCEVSTGDVVVANFAPAATTVTSGRSLGKAASRRILGYAHNSASVRRLSTAASRLQVDSKIAARDLASADTIIHSLTQEVLNYQLSNHGLPNANILSVSVQSIAAGRGAEFQTTVIIGSVMCMLLLGIAAFGLHLYLSGKRESEEERELRLKVKEMRARLCIQRRDGYILSSEAAPLWGGAYSVLQAGHVESAARLALFRDFDVHQFDAFCLYVETGNSVGGGFGFSFSAKAFERNNRAYSAVCGWLLDIATQLIRPELPADVQGATTPPPAAAACPLRVEDRFSYLTRKVCRARIWDDEGGALFERLQCAATSFMLDIGRLCDERFERLRTEPGGGALVAWSAASLPAAGDIARQDHEQVRLASLLRRSYPGQSFMAIS